LTAFSAFIGSWHASRSGFRRSCPDLDLAALFEIDGRIENDLVAVLDAVAHFDFPAKIARDRDGVHMDDAILDHGNVQAVLIEDHRVGGNDERRRLARDLQLDGAIDTRDQRSIRVWHIDFGQQRPGSGGLVDRIRRFDPFDCRASD
jgi:hypothetical protein